MYATVTFFILIASLFVLWLSSDRVIIHATLLAQKLGVSNLFIGFFVLAVATGLPELAIALQAILANKPLLSAGNILGANFSDISLCLGLAALLFGPIYTHTGDLKKQLTILLLSSFVMAFVFIMGQLNQIIGVFLIGLYLLSAVWLFKTTVPLEEALENSQNALLNQTTILRSAINLFLFLLLILLSSKICVMSALSVALQFKIPEYIIGVIIIGVGASLPELSVTIQSVKQKKYGLAIGNSLGSVFEQGALILGILALGLSKPLSLVHLRYIAPFMFFAYGVIGYCLLIKRRVDRREGVLLLLAYVLFVFYSLWR